MANYSGKGAPSNGSVYVCNLPEGTDETMLAEYFGTIGLLKKDKRTGRPKIWQYRDKETNEPKGDATVTYEDPHAAVAAVEWFNNKDFHGNIIGVHIAESKSRGDNVYNAGLDPSFAAESAGAEEDVGDINEGSGRGRGLNDASGKAWQQEGDWLCPNTSGAGGGGRGKGRKSHETGGPGRSVGGPTGLFGPNDWPCPMCGNINWAKRMKCNICNTNKPGHNEGGVRGGRGGGYKELDEEELEETKRRRREAEEDDGELYDEFGNLKKKFRAKTQEAESGRVPHGAGRAGWDVEELGIYGGVDPFSKAGVVERDARERSRDGARAVDNRERSKHREREYRERHRSRSRERDRVKDTERDYGYDRDIGYGREKDRDRDRDRDWNRHRY